MPAPIIVPDKARLEKALKTWGKATQSLNMKVRASEHLTENDFSIRINAKG